MARVILTGRVRRQTLVRAAATRAGIADSTAFVVWDGGHTVVCPTAKVVSYVCAACVVGDKAECATGELCKFSDRHDRRDASVCLYL